MLPSKPAEEKENNKNALSPVINIYSIDIPIALLFSSKFTHQSGWFLSERREKAEMLKSAAGYNREWRIRERGRSFWIWEKRRIPK